jgi:type I restriction enzyme S subunit
MEQQLYELPAGWEWKPLTFVTDLSRKSIRPNKEEDYNYIGLEHIEGETGRLVDYAPTNGSKISSTKTTFSRGMVLYGKLRPYLNKVHVAKFDGIATTEILPFKCWDGLNAEYLASYMRSAHFLDSVMGNCSGARMPRATTKFFKYIAQIPIPPLNEQKRIVAKLDALFTRIDAAITHLQQTLELSKALLASGTNEIFDALVDEYGKVSLAEVVKINSGIALPKIFKDWQSSGSIPFYKVAQMNNDQRIMKDAEITFDLKIASENRIKIFPKGSVLIPKRGGAILTDKKRMLTEDASYDSNIMGLEADRETIIDEYLFRFLLSINLGDYIDTAVIPQINNKHIERMEIPLAPISEQGRTVSHLDALSELTSVLEAATQEKLNDLTTLKASLLDAAFKGQL